MTAPVHPFLPRTHVAYFSMEIAIRPEMHTYAGGLGVLAGDTVRSCADLQIPVVFVTLASRAGYFLQQIDIEGRQTEAPDWWDPASFCIALNAMVAVEMGGRPVWVRPWLYVHTCPHGHEIPILLLDTDLDQNDAEDRALTHYLYGGDETYRMKQELVLGLGGIRLLRALGFQLHTYHMNEGHSAFLALELLNQHRFPPEDVRSGESPYDIAEVREHCVFTTHTPVEAGSDRFSYAQFETLVDGLIEIDEIRRLAGPDQLNMTQLALNVSGYINGVARRHAETTRQMFPGHQVPAITNGVHPGFWTHDAFARLFDAHVPHWRHEPETLVRALMLADEDIWGCHLTAKAGLIARIRTATGVALDPERPILAYARRMTGYKRPLLLFSDIARLARIAERYPLQIVMAGKAHPRDAEGKEAIRQLHAFARQLEGRVPCAFLPNYDLDLARALVSGADIWLNTPLPPLEASGTSGMKAALNGVLNLSVLDGWWIEASIEGVTGWSIGTESDATPAAHAALLYDKIEQVVLPLYHSDRAAWRRMMKQAIGMIGYYFNSQRMMRRYASEAYLR
jgi:starch phosphorylase